VKDVTRAVKFAEGGQIPFLNECFKNLYLAFNGTHRPTPNIALDVL
jgi:hypothetical protein